MAEKIDHIVLNVEGMTCSNCAMSITRTLSNKGIANVDTNFATGEVSFDIVEAPEKVEDVVKTINDLGFKVIEENKSDKNTGFSGIEKKLIFSMIFTIPLFFSHMILSHEHFLNEPLVQLGLCLPVFILGVLHFGRSAYGSLKGGVPNMDVLIITGTTAAFAYSLAGTIMYYGTHEVHNYIFYETAAVIITLVLLGNVMEYRSFKQTTSAVKELTKLQTSVAKKVIASGATEKIIEILSSEIRKGDVLLVNTGDKIPVDGKIISGRALLDESMITGESLPLEKGIDGEVIGGTIMTGGSIRMTAEKVGKDTVLSQIIELVKNARAKRPAIQSLGDRISAVFVPIVVGIALLTFVVWFFFLDATLSKSIMTGIAVLVISCPCAMGLAAPTAVMVGIGRGAKNGILIKGGSTLEDLSNVKTVVFDKTGTLTTGNFLIKDFQLLNGSDKQSTMNIIYSMEQHSSHPIAKSLVTQLAQEAANIKLEQVEEIKGSGLKAKDESGNEYFLGSSKDVKNSVEETGYSMYLLRNGNPIAALEIEDEIKPKAKELIDALKKEGFQTVLLSGDKKEKCEALAAELGIDKVYSEKLPAEKLEIIESFEKEGGVAMVGDGINDAPALEKATVGISLGNATQVAIQSAQVILLNGKDLENVRKAFRVGKHSVITIKENFFWAFVYNIVAIPFAAMGFLSPMIAALAMAFSDVVVIGNSIRLRTKNIF
jgi:P-type Cu+ transporter